MIFSVFLIGGSTRFIAGIVPRPGRAHPSCDKPYSYTIKNEGGSKMKRDVTEPRTFCDFCKEPGSTQCMVCGKDLCSKHRVELAIHLDRRDWVFQASLCPEDAQTLLPFLVSLKDKSTSWEKAGQNPEFNEARLMDIIVLLQQSALGVAK
jgi:hypothetical protein